MIREIIVMYLPKYAKSFSVAQGQSYDCFSAIEPTVSNFDQIGKYLITTNTTERVHCVYISWAVFIRPDG